MYLKLSKMWAIAPNFTLSSNKNVDFVSDVSGALTNLGDTNIAYSPNFIAGSNFVYQPFTKLKMALLSKFVGEQYMGNIDNSNSKLDSYFVNDFNVSFEITPNKIVESIRFDLLVNNIFNVEYISNGYYYTYDDDWSVPGDIITLDGAGYYPQAGINFLLGATVRF